MTLGLYLLALSTVSHEFESAHQPIQDLGDHIPGQEVLAFITGIWLIAGGMAIFWRRSARAGAVAVAIVYFVPVPGFVGLRQGSSPD